MVSRVGKTGSFSKLRPEPGCTRFLSYGECARKNGVWATSGLGESFAIFLEAAYLPSQKVPLRSTFKWPVVA
jgi:hypothetical protein